MLKPIIAVLLLGLVVSELVQAVTIFRHGSRYPLNSVYDGDQTKADRGQITPTGMRQHYNLGSMIRKEYIIDNPFLKSSFNHSQIDVRSTDYNRTLMSAGSFLLGLYPEQTGFKIPATVKKSCLIPPYQGMTDDIPESDYALPHGRQVINVKSDSEEKLFIDCAPQVVINIDNAHATLDQMTAKYNPFLLNLTKIFKEPYPISIMNISRFFDTSACDKFLNRPLPEDLSEKDYLNMRHLHYFSNYIRYSARFAYGVNTPKFYYIFSKFQNAINNPAGLFKMGIFSCHDTDLYPLQAQLNISSANCIEELYRFNKTTALNCEPGPEFASSMVLELHKQSNQYNVKIKYNGKYVYLCERQETSCPYAEFVARVTKNYQDYKKICKS